MEKEKHAKKKSPKEEQVTVLKSEFEALKARADEKEMAYDKYMRLRAEFDNALKRLEREREAFMRYANEHLIIDFLPIVDNLEMAEKYIKEAKDFNGVRAGVDMIHGQIQRFLAALGVKKIACVGEKFDPNQHEVMEAEESSEQEDIVIAELKPGYTLNGKLLRPASVKITKKKETND